MPSTVRHVPRVKVVVLAAVPALVVGVVWVATALLTGPEPTATAPLPEPVPATAPVVEEANGSQPAATVPPVRPAASWIATVAARTGVPARALQAYGTAQLIVQAQDPGCHLGWTTLAGIGAIESDHGRHGGSLVGADGIDRPTVLGPPLDGTGGNKAVADTDRGALDGDPTWDRAVGPMQFIPTTWAQWGRSVGGGVPNPSNIDDAALTAAVYLCASRQDMATPAGWTAAIASYNEPFAYAVSVAGVANGYAARSTA